MSVCLDGGVADVQLLRDLCVGEAVGDQAKDLLFTRGQLGELFGGRGARDASLSEGRCRSAGGEAIPWRTRQHSRTGERGDRYELGTRTTGQTKLFTMPMSVAAPAARAALTSSSLSKSPDPFVSNAATAAE